MLYNCVQKQVQFHTDFVSTHLDMIHDVTGLGQLEGSGLASILSLEAEIKQASQRASRPVELPGWHNYPMTPVASSFIKGAGAYKGKLLLEFHFDPGKIWGYDVQGQGTQFFEELMLSGSKGGWVWDKILGKPSQFGMAKGKFFSYKGPNGEQKFATTPGAQFVHHYGRPSEFTYNPVGYLNDSEEWYNVRAQEGKIWKESLVDPSQSRNPIDPSLLREMQRNTAFTELQEKLKRRKAIEELGPMIEKEQRREVLGEISKLIKPHLTKKDFTELLQFLLDSQMTLTPIMAPVIDLVEDYHVQGYIKKSGIKVKTHKRGENLKLYKEIQKETVRKNRKKDSIEGSIIKKKLSSTEKGFYDAQFTEFEKTYSLKKEKKLLDKEALTEDYKVKGYYANRGKPPVRTFVRRHTREEGTTIKHKPRLTSQMVRAKHAKNIREKRKDIIPIWLKLRRLRKKLEKINEKIKALNQKGYYGHGFAFDRKMQTLLDEKFDIRDQLTFTSRKTLENRIEWEEKNIERIKSLPAEDRTFPDLWEWEHGLAKSKRELERIKTFEKGLFESHNDLDIQYGFDKPLHEKIRVAKGIIYKNPFGIGMKIEHINSTFKKLPKNVRDSCKEVRIFEIANDDPTYSSLEGCGGFYSHANKTITIGLRTTRSKRSPWLYSFGFVREATVHEGAHALDFQKLSIGERMETNRRYDVNKDLLEIRKEYAKKNSTEFFAEGYVNAYVENNKWFQGMTSGTKKFFQDIIRKYDFVMDLIMTPLNEKINGIKFSYEFEEKQIFGFFRIPEEISQEEAEIMVSEGKAQFENVDKYIDFGDKNE